MNPSTKDWQKCSLSEVTSLIRDGSHGTHNDVAEGVAFLSAKDVRDGTLLIPDDCRRIAQSEYDSLHRSYEIERDDILLTIVGSIGRCCLVSGNEPQFTVQRSVGIIRPSCIAPTYLFQFFRSAGFQQTLKELTNASAQGGVYLGSLAQAPIEFPSSKPEQTKIAEILSTVDRAIEQTEALIAKQQRLKTGLMQDLLTCGIDEHGNLRSEQTHPFKDSPLGRIPVEWEVKQIKDVGLVVTGNTPSESAFADDYQSVPFITPADVGVSSAIQKTTRSFGKTSATSVRMIPAGSICVVCIGSTIGKIGVTVGEAASNQQINTVIPHESKTSEFLLHSMLLYLPSQLRKEAGLQAVPIVNKSTFERLFIAIPRDSKEAIEIQHQISSPAAIAESGTRTLVKLRALKTALMQDLLTGRKRVTELLNNPEASA